ncbi:diphthine--ammonia ligase [Pedobacter yonginense]|uniref:Diphthine--ammonia ligase n=1 Tax=Pedobacter yonginense TaxID=651869 RepID=A0A317ET24_9SPHI|nr:diphthine--ammonia ligase [Pedobacter yonginense]PWS29033.1 diphthine--ammonia ligase [Pedobacter yonginense]
MITKKQCIFNWSGGKDSTLALHYALQNPEIEIKYLVTTLSEKYNRVSMHGVREELLIKQAESIGIPLIQIKLPDMPDMETYDRIMHQQLTSLKEKGITHAIFGDIFLADLRKYREDKLAELGLKAIFPLWDKNTTLLIDEFLKLHYKTIIVCAQQNLQHLCGKVITTELIKALSPTIDPCGENGEFHTFAFEGPIFKQKIDFQLGDLVFRTFNTPIKCADLDVENEAVSTEIGFWYSDLI